VRRVKKEDKDENKEKGHESEKCKRSMEWVREEGGYRGKRVTEE
jgi:hypothetical protein